LWEGCPFPKRLWDLGERPELPTRVRVKAPDKAILVGLRIKRLNGCQREIIALYSFIGKQELSKHLLGRGVDKTLLHDHTLIISYRIDLRMTDTT